MIDIPAAGVAASDIYASKIEINVQSCARAEKGFLRQWWRQLAVLQGP